MGLSTLGGRVAAGPDGADLTATHKVRWHDLECGAYTADLALWRELAGAEAGGGTRGAILDVGAGTGRVALELARAGHAVTAVDLDPDLLAALAARAGSLPVTTVTADARELALTRREHALCIVPMQTLQLLGGPRARVRFLEAARAHLRPGGLLACALVTELEPFDCDDGDLGPAAETLRADGLLYRSRAVRVQVRARSIVIERDRAITPLAGMRGATARERDVVELDRVGQRRLEREGARAGLRAAGVRSIPETAEHVGSIVVMLRA